jgi:hypothetical protein
LVQTLIGAIGTIYASTRSRVRIHALHIQRWRPNGWTEWDPNWYKHSLGQSAQVMGVGVCIAGAARATRNYGGAVVPHKREVGERARSARVHEWNMAVQPPRARSAHIVECGAKTIEKVAESQIVDEWNMPWARSVSAHSVEQNKKLRNLRKTVRGSMRRVNVNTGMLNKRALYWHMLVVY